MAAPRAATPKNFKYELNMDHRQFFYLTAQVREAQKAYFKTRDPVVFRACRKLENELDKEIERVRQIVNN